MTWPLRLTPASQDVSLPYSHMHSTCAALNAESFLVVYMETSVGKFIFVFLSFFIKALGPAFINTQRIPNPLILVRLIVISFSFFNLLPHHSPSPCTTAFRSRPFPLSSDNSSTSNGCVCVVPNHGCPESIGECFHFSYSTPYSLPQPDMSSRNRFTAHYLVPLQENPEFPTENMKTMRTTE